MHSVITKLVPGGEKPYNTEIVSVTLPTAEMPVLTLVVDIWPDEYEYSGPRERKVIEALDALLLSEVAEKDLRGYEVRNLEVDDAGEKLRIDTTLRRIELKIGRYRVT